MRKSNLDHFEDVDISINSGNPTPEEFAEISRYIQAYKKKQELREKKKKSSKASNPLKKAK